MIAMMLITTINSRRVKPRVGVVRRSITSCYMARRSERFAARQSVHGRYPVDSDPPHSRDLPDRLSNQPFPSWDRQAISEDRWVRDRREFAATGLYPSGIAR